MVSLIIFSVIAAGVAGIIIKIVLDLSRSNKEITWKEYIIGFLAISLIVAPSVTAIGWKVAKSNQMTFNEYWNGWEKEAVWEITKCSRDGPCRNTYACDPYQVPYTSCDSKGNCTTEYRTEYHSCPYTKEEWTFGVDTTLGLFLIASHTFPENPQAHRWRSYESVPQYVISRAGSGFPDFWSAAKARLDVGKPGPVTKREQYKNYLLASDQTILKQYSSQVDYYLSLKLLPQVQGSVEHFYYADKVQFVGFSPKDPNAWQRNLMYFNAALGTELQGDMHLVVVKNDIVSNNPDSYTLALKAYWINKEIFGNNAISKNGIIVVMGTKDGETVAWARATTGMPMGNEQLIVAVRNFSWKNIPLTPDAVMGDVRGEFFTEIDSSSGLKKLKIKGAHNKGVLERIVWGIDESQTKFKRVKMSEFGYLEGEIQPTGWQKLWIILITFFVGLPIWLVMVAIGERSWKHSR